MKTMKRHRSGRRHPCASTKLARQAKRDCEGFGLLLLVEPPQGVKQLGEQWSIFDRLTGRHVATYWPGPRRLFVGGSTSHHCKDWSEALRGIVARVVRQQAS